MDVDNFGEPIDWPGYEHTPATERFYSILKSSVEGIIGIVCKIKYAPEDQGGYILGDADAGKLTEQVSALMLGNDRLYRSKTSAENSVPKRRFDQYCRIADKAAKEYQAFCQAAWLLDPRSSDWKKAVGGIFHAISELEETRGWAPPLQPLYLEDLAPLVTAVTEGRERLEKLATEYGPEFMRRHDGTLDIPRLANMLKIPHTSDVSKIYNALLAWIDERRATLNSINKIDTPSDKLKSTLRALTNRVIRDRDKLETALEAVSRDPEHDPEPFNQVLGEILPTNGGTSFRSFLNRAIVISDQGKFNLLTSQLTNLSEAYNAMIEELSQEVGNDFTSLWGKDCVQRVNQLVISIREYAGELPTQSKLEPAPLPIIPTEYKESSPKSSNWNPTNSNGIKAGTDFLELEKIHEIPFTEEHQREIDRIKESFANMPSLSDVLNYPQTWFDQVGFPPEALEAFQGGSNQAGSERQAIGPSIVKVDESTLSPYQAKAWHTYQIAEEALLGVGDKVTDDVAYGWLSEHGIDDYELPSRETWKKYVREARRLLGRNKNLPRSGRTGRSTGKAEDL